MAAQIAEHFGLEKILNLLKKDSSQSTRGFYSVFMPIGP
jgi:hypothetical protein